MCCNSDHPTKSVWGLNKIIWSKELRMLNLSHRNAQYVFIFVSFSADFMGICDLHSHTGSLMLRRFQHLVSCSACCCLEFLHNFQMRSTKFSFYIRPCKLCSGLGFTQLNCKLFEVWDAIDDFILLIYSSMLSPVLCIYWKIITVVYLR